MSQPLVNEDQTDELIRDLLTRIEFGVGQFQLGFVFGESFKDMLEFQHRLFGELEFRIPRALATLHRASGRASAEQLLTAIRANGPMQLIWCDLHSMRLNELRKFLVLLNECRGELSKRVRGLLILAMRNPYDSDVRAIAPDLWSVRSFAMAVSTTEAGRVADVADGPQTGVAVSATAPSATPGGLIAVARRAEELARRHRNPAEAIELASSLAVTASQFAGIDREDDLLALNRAADLFDELLVYKFAVFAYRNLLTIVDLEHASRVARKLGENLLADRQPSNAALALDHGLRYQSKAPLRERQMLELLTAEIRLAQGDYQGSQALFIAIWKANLQRANALEVRALSGLAIIYRTQSHRISEANLFAERGLVQSAARIEKRGLKPIRALRHAKLMRIQNSIDQLRGDPERHNIDRYLAHAIEELGPVPELLRFQENCRSPVANELANPDASG